MSKPLAANNEENVQIVQEQKPIAKGVEPELLTIDELMGGEASMPEIQPHAIEAAKTATKNIEQAHQSPHPAKSSAPVKGITDDVGRKFDPLIHEADAAGKPRLNKAGYIAKRRGGGAKGATGSKIDKSKTESPQTTPQSMEPAIQASAQMFTGLFLTTVAAIGGEEFKPVVDAKTGENEPQFLQDTFANYFRIKGVIDIPPGIALTLGLGFYVAKRWNAPKFTERRTSWFGGVRRWWSDFRLRRKMAKEIKEGQGLDTPANDSENK